ncbi:6094_t:CDS:2 [Ambispora gerdemannii]|uniref:6094_t:CDS:1 n=1 Tax=Ambispora gerdemannii TaxID=144530 RepID=A0A9N9C1E1_9GLOM|nr:6094_t:CDS:2 [Ambispora gerdemannii]
MSKFIATNGTHSIMEPEAGPSKSNKSSKSKNHKNRNNHHQNNEIPMNIDSGGGNAVTDDKRRLALERIENQEMEYRKLAQAITKMADCQRELYQTIESINDDKVSEVFAQLFAQLPNDDISNNIYTGIPQYNLINNKKMILPQISSISSFSKNNASNDTAINISKEVVKVPFWPLPDSQPPPQIYHPNPVSQPITNTKIERYRRSRPDKREKWNLTQRQWLTREFRAHYERRVRLDDNVTKKGVAYELEQLIHGRPEIHVYQCVRSYLTGRTSITNLEVLYAIEKWIKTEIAHWGELSEEDFWFD